MKPLIFILSFIWSPFLLMSQIDVGNLVEKQNIAYQTRSFDGVAIDLSISQMMDVSERKFVPIGKKKFYKADGRNSSWLKLDILNTSDFSKDMVLASEFAIVDTALYYLVSRKNIVNTGFSGKNLSDEIKGTKYPYPHFKFSLPANFSGSIYIKVNSCRQIFLPLNLWNENDFILNFSNKSLLMGFIFGTIFLFVFASLVFYFLDRKPFFLLYLAYILSVTLVEAEYYGILYRAFSRSYPFINHMEFLVFGVIFFALFIRELFDTKIKYPIFDRLVVILVIVEFFEFFLRAGYHFLPDWAVLPYRILDLVTTIAVLVFSLTIIYFAYKEYKLNRKLRHLWVLFSLVTFLISVFFYFLLLTGNIPLYAIYFVLPVSIFIEMVMMFVVFAYDYFELQTKQSETKLALASSQFKATTNLLVGQENERKRLAIDLHDGVGAMISSIKMHFQAFVRDNPTIDKSDAFLRTNKLISDTYDEVRSISHNLMPLDVLDLGLENAIRSTSKKVFLNSQTDVKCQFDIDDIPISQEIQLNVFRIIQEIFTNIIKHSNAKSVLLQFNLNKEYIHIEIENDGDIFDTDCIESSEGIGLQNIKNRTEYLKGEFNLISDESTGTIYSILIPYTNAIRNA